MLGGYSGYPKIAMKECNFPKDFFRWIDLFQIHTKMNSDLNEEENISKILFSKLSSMFKKNHEEEYDIFVKKCSDPSHVNHDDINSLSLLNKSLYIDYHYKSLQINLNKYDRFSMAHGIESRFPFLDYNLAQYLFSLPTTSKIKNGFTKRILRDSVRGIVPEKVLNRVKKKGFNPANELFNKTMINFINDTINSKEFVEFDIWDGKKIKSFINSGNNINYKKMFKYIQIYYLEKTFRKKIYN